jgi:hypothetical protein
MNEFQFDADRRSLRLKSSYPEKDATLLNSQQIKEFPLWDTVRRYIYCTRFRFLTIKPIVDASESSLHASVIDRRQAEVRTHYSDSEYPLLAPRNLRDYRMGSQGFFLFVSHLTH